MFKYISVVFLVGLGLLAKAQKQYQVMDWKTDVTLNTYLVQLMKSQYEQRRQAFAHGLNDKNKALAYAKEVKAKAASLFKNLPPKAALNAKVTGVLQKAGYHIEKLTYQSFSNHHVTANLYVPQGKGPFAAVLFLCGHEDAAKATESYQKTAILLAKNGFVVLVIDPVSQSERVQLTDNSGKSLTRGATTEHTLLNLQSNLLGTSVAAFELLDNQCGIDYLSSRQEVDASKIGCLGNSGGAIQAIYLAAIDDRVKAIAPCSYLANRENTLATTGAADGCAQIPNEGALQLEMSDYLIAAAPKPILILAGRYDFIDYSGTLQSVDDLKKFYGKLNAGNKIKCFTYDDGHGISKPKREIAVQWFKKWFYNDDKKVTEPNLNIESEEALFVSAKGKLNLTDLDEQTIPQYNSKHFEALAAKREEFSKMPLQQRLAKISSLLQLNLVNKLVDVESTGELTKGGAKFQKVIVRKSGQPPLPLLVYQPKKTINKVMVFLNEGGKSKLLDSMALYQKLIDEGNTALILCDLRGVGETTDKASLNDPKYYNDDYRNAMLSLHIGKPLLGQRTDDILTLMNYIGQWQQPAVDVEVTTMGNIGIAALHASLFSPAIKKVNLYACLKSYREIFDQPLAKNNYHLVVNDLASYYDIPDLLSWQSLQQIKFY